MPFVPKEKKKQNKTKKGLPFPTPGGVQFW